MHAQHTVIHAHPAHRNSDKGWLNECPAGDGDGAYAAREEVRWRGRWGGGKRGDEGAWQEEGWCPCSRGSGVLGFWGSRVLGF